MKRNTLSGRVTRKGQVTIPVQIRKNLNIEEGDRLEFINNPENKIEIKVVKKRSLNAVFGKLAVDKPMPFEEERAYARFSAGQDNLSRDFQGND
jgi:AbrB family looped-hinge helix DNA binding protein